MATLNLILNECSFYRAIELAMLLNDCLDIHTYIDIYAYFGYNSIAKRKCVRYAHKREIRRCLSFFFILMS